MNKMRTIMICAASTLLLSLSVAHGQEGVPPTADETVKAPVVTPNEQVTPEPEKNAAPMVKKIAEVRKNESGCLETGKSEIEEFSRSLRGSFEIGFLGVLDHQIQFGENTTYFSYNQDGGQDILFPITRLSLDMNLSPRHTLVLLYQPLDIVSREILDEAITIDQVTFAAGTAMEFRYSFPFYRVSYLYDFIENEIDELAIGLSLQIRNTTIEFLNLDGTQIVRNSNIGPVPIIKFRARHNNTDGSWYGTEIDGFYAPVSYINGSDNEVVGAILDASVRYGWQLMDAGEAFLNVRYLGGGAVGSSDDDGRGAADGYTKNWLHFLTVSVGLNYTLAQ